MNKSVNNRLIELENNKEKSWKDITDTYATRDWTTDDVGKWIKITCTLNSGKELTISTGRLGMNGTRFTVDLNVFLNTYHTDDDYIQKMLYDTTGDKSKLTIYRISAVPSNTTDNGYWRDSEDITKFEIQE